MKEFFKKRFLLVFLGFSIFLGAYYSLAQKQEDAAFLYPLSAENFRQEDLAQNVSESSNLPENKKSILGKILGESARRVFPFKGLFSSLVPTLTPSPAIQSYRENTTPTLVVSQFSPTVTPTTPTVTTINVPSSSTVTPTPTSTMSPSPTPILTGDQISVSNTGQLVISYLVSKRYADLYNLMSQDFKATFSESDFVGSLANSTDISAGVLVGLPKVYGASSEWSEQSEDLTLKDGSIKRYLLVMRKENGVWTLYGTEDQ